MLRIPCCELKSSAPALRAETAAIDGATSRRSVGIDATAPHRVSALALGGCTVSIDASIDAIGAQPGDASLSTSTTIFPMEQAR